MLQMKSERKVMGLLERTANATHRTWPSCCVERLKGDRKGNLEEGKKCTFTDFRRYRKRVCITLTWKEECTHAVKVFAENSNFSTAHSETTCFTLPMVVTAFRLNLHNLNSKHDHTVKQAMTTY